jgi:hypothetical protein
MELTLCQHRFASARWSVVIEESKVVVDRK